MLFHDRDERCRDPRSGTQKTHCGCGLPEWAEWRVVAWRWVKSTFSLYDGRTRPAHRAALRRHLERQTDRSSRPDVFHLECTALSPRNIRPESAQYKRARSEMSMADDHSAVSFQPPAVSVKNRASSDELAATGPDLRLECRAEALASVQRLGVASRLRAEADHVAARHLRVRDCGGHQGR